MSRGASINDLQPVPDPALVTHKSTVLVETIAQALPDKYSVGTPAYDRFEQYAKARDPRENKRVLSVVPYGFKQALGDAERVWRLRSAEDLAGATTAVNAEQLLEHYLRSFADRIQSHADIGQIIEIVATVPASATHLQIQALKKVIERVFATDPDEPRGGRPRVKIEYDEATAAAIYYMKDSWQEDILSFWAESNRLLVQKDKEPDHSGEFPDEEEIQYFRGEEPDPQSIRELIDLEPGVPLRGDDTSSKKLGEHWFNILVFDVGGGTIDIALIRNRLERWDIRHQNGKIQSQNVFRVTPEIAGLASTRFYGGNNMTLAVYAALKRALAIKLGQQLRRLRDREELKKDALIEALGEQAWPDEDAENFWNALNEIVGTSDELDGAVERLLPTRWKTMTHGDARDLRERFFRLLFALAEDVKIAIVSGGIKELGKHDVEQEDQQFRITPEVFDKLGALTDLLGLGKRTDVDLSVMLEKKSFDERIRRALEIAWQRALGLCKNVAGRRVPVDRVLLAGNGAQYPLVRKTLEETFATGGRPLQPERILFNPSDAKTSVCQGALIGQVISRLAPEHLLETDRPEIDLRLSGNRLLPFDFVIAHYMDDRETLLFPRNMYLPPSGCFARRRVMSRVHTIPIAVRYPIDREEKPFELEIFGAFKLPDTAAVQLDESVQYQTVFELDANRFLKSWVEHGENGTERVPLDFYSNLGDDNQLERLKARLADLEDPFDGSH